MKAIRLLAGATGDEDEEAPGAREGQAEAGDEPGRSGMRARRAAPAAPESPSSTTDRKSDPGFGDAESRDGLAVPRTSSTARTRRSLPPRTRMLLERLEGIVSPERSAEVLISAGWNLADDAPDDPNASVLGWVDGPLFLHLVRTLGLDGAAELRAELFLLLGSGPTMDSHRISQRPTTPAPPPKSTVPAPPDPEMVAEGRRSRRAPTEPEVPRWRGPSEDEGS